MDEYEDTTPTVNQPRRLTDLCVRSLERRLHVLPSVGKVPFHLIKRVLIKATPVQLEKLESASPQIIGETESLWRTHCLRDFPSTQPSKPVTWRDHYMRCRHDRKKATSSIGEKLRKMKEIGEAEREKRKAVLLDATAATLTKKRSKGWGAAATISGAKKESGLLSKARKDAQLAATRRGSLNPPVKRSAPSDSSSATTLAPPAKRLHSSSSLTAKPAASPYKSKLMSSLYRKMN